jgi:hypothetical protein
MPAGAPEVPATLSSTPGEDTSRSQFSLAKSLEQTSQLDLAKALDQMSALKSGQLTDAELAPSDRQNIEAAKSALADIGNNREKLRDTVDRLEASQKDAEQTRIEINAQNDKDIAIGVRATQGLAVIHTIFTLARVGDLVKNPAGIAASATIDTVEGVRKISKASNDTAELISATERRARELSYPIGTGSLVEGDSINPFGSSQTSIEENLRNGWEKIVKPAYETPKFLPETLKSARESLEAVDEVGVGHDPQVLNQLKGSKVLKKFKGAEEHIELANMAVDGLDLLLNERDYIEAKKRGDLKTAREKLWEGAGNFTSVFVSDKAGKVVKSVNDVRKDLDTVADLIEMREKDPLLDQNLRAQDRIDRARSLEIYYQRCRLLDLCATPSIESMPR